MTVSASAPPWTAAASLARAGRWARLLLRGRETMSSVRLRTRSAPRRPGGACDAHSPVGFTEGRWVRPSLLGLLLGSAVLYLWGLGRSGYANDYYSAAVQAGATSWKAFFFGSFDASNYITVDKTPASLWVMELSARLFGVNSWSILAPQAIEGVLAVGLLYAAVRRVSGPAAGLLAGAVAALTPVATLMFRFNNPDAMLVLLMVLGGYATVRAVETGRTTWLLLAGSAVGFGFLAKMLQALLVVPAFGLAYLVAGPPRLRRRIAQLAAGLVALVVSAGWWVAIVELMPASARPYVGGSHNNSILELTLGYNGLGRLTGDEAGTGGGGPPGGLNGGGGGFGGATGWNRLFSAEMGGQASWLLPTALIALVAGLWLAGRRPRTDPRRASYLLWGGSLLVTVAVFSYMRGIFHSYYLIALAPPTGALVGMAAVDLWQRRREWLPRVLLAAMIGTTAVWSAVLLNRSPDWNPWLRPLVLATGAAAAVGLLAGPLAGSRLRFAGPRLRRAAAPGVAGIGLVAALAGPAAYTLSTAATAHTGPVPSAGPAAAGGFGPGGGRFAGQLPGGGQFPGGQLPDFGDLPGQGQLPGGQFPGGQFPGGQFPGGQGGPAGGGPAGRDRSTTVDSKLVDLLRGGGGDGYTWTAAAVGAMSAAPLQLASGEPIMALGGFSGTDPATTLAEFKQLVTAGKVHYFIADRGLGGAIPASGGQGGPSGGQGGPFGGSSASSEIVTWVQGNFTAKTVGDTTVYDLSAANTS